MPARARECRARVVATRALARDVLEADLGLEDPPALPFEAGQWISVPFGDKRVRAYSIASTPQSPSRLTLAADVAPGGIGSAWFRSLRPGDEVRFKGPLGGFVFQRADRRRPIFVAEEIGIVPIRSIVHDLYERGFGRPVLLVAWAREPGLLVYDAEFRRLARRQPGFAYHPVVAAAGAAWAGTTGDLAGAVGGLVGEVADVVAHVAGGAAAITAVREVLMARGLERKAVRWEKFW
jgi:NAD(P)H-flavin reductase